MKKTLLLSLAFLIISSFEAKAQTFKTAVEYLDFLNLQSVAVTKDMWDYTSSIARSKGAKQIETKRKAVLAEIQKAVKNVQASKPYNNQEFIKDAFIEYLKLNFDVLNEDYAKIVDLEAVSEQSYDAMEAYMEVTKQVNVKMNEISNKLQMEVATYAADNKITLSEEETKIGKKLDRANKAFDYYQPLYLVFFKSYIQEANFYAALATKDLSAAEQAKNALHATAEEGLAKLKEINGYEGDGALKNACGDAIRFYMKESSKDLQTLLDFYTKQDTFEKLDAAMKKKKKGDITKAESDEYNKAVNEYNAAVKTYNTINNSLNSEREKSIDGWNKNTQSFLLKHAA